MFSSYCDGIIAPKIFSPLQYDLYLHEEIILFDVNKLRLINEDIIVKLENISSIITTTNKPFKFSTHSLGSTNKDIQFNAYMQGGNKIIQDKNIFFDDKNKVKKAKRLAKRLAKYFGFESSDLNNSHNYIDEEITDFLKFDKSENFYDKHPGGRFRLNIKYNL